MKPRIPVSSEVVIEIPRYSGRSKLVVSIDTWSDGSHAVRIADWRTRSEGARAGEPYRSRDCIVYPGELQRLVGAFRTADGQLRRRES